jgi:hypothetical protein
VRCAMRPTASGRACRELHDALRPRLVQLPAAC